MKLGTTVRGRYHIESLLGKGGMGAVYLAHDLERNGAAVAVKELLGDGLDDEAADPDADRAITQFQREATLLASLDHPNLVEVLDFFEEGDRHYLVMSYVEGRTLEQVLREEGPPPYGRVLDWMDEVCDVLDYLHRQDPPILFRDLKPNNVMLDRDGHVKLIDFGIARAFGGDKTTTYIAGAGTVGYSPVEQFTGGTDPRSDVYALGATIYCMLTGQVPPMSVKMLNGEAVRRPIHELNPTVPPEVEEVVAELMALKREHRCPSVAEARRLLQGAAGRTRVPGRDGACPRCAAALTRNARACAACGETFALPDLSAETERKRSDDTLPPKRAPQPEEPKRPIQPERLPATRIADPAPVPPPGRRTRNGMLAVVAVALILGSGATIRALGPAAPLPSPSAPAAAAPEGALRDTLTDLYGRYTDGLNNRVSSGITAMMAPDFKAQTAPGREVDGQTFVRNQMTELTKLAEPQVTVTVDRVDGADDTVKVTVQRHMKASYLDPTGKHAVAQESTQLDTWRKTAEGWRWLASKRTSDKQTFDGQPTMLFPPW